MGLFTSSKRMSMQDIKRALWGVSVLGPDEREHIQKLFMKYDTNGVSRREIRLAVREMKREMDEISNTEAREVKRALIRALKAQ